MTTPRFIIGIDAGGTSLRAALAQTGSAIPLWESETTSLPGGGPGALVPLLPLLLARASVSPDQVRAVCAGITKITREGIARQWEDALAGAFPLARIQVAPDYEIAFHGALPNGQGIMVIAGTGSVAFAVHGSKSARVGGRGWEYGDEGSGAHLTTEVIRRTLRALDGMEPPSALTDGVCDLLHRDPAQLGEIARQQAQTGGRGFLVPFLLERARQGDKDAANLFIGAGGWLAALVRAGLTRVGVRADDTPQVGTVGGLWQAGGLLGMPFARVVRRWYPHAHIAPGADSPLVGALRQANRLLD